MRRPSSHFRPAEVRDLLRLSHALHEAPPEPAVRKRALLERPCRLLRDDAAVCVVSLAEASSVGAAGAIQSVTVLVVRYGMTEEDAWILAARYRSGAPPRPRRRTARTRSPARGPQSRRIHARAGARHDANGVPAGHFAESVLDLPGMKMQASVALLRRRPAGRAFTIRDHATLRPVHSELSWVYGPDLPLLSPDGLPLSPRQRQTLQLLLAGNSEKEIVGQMGLSPNTVHHYVKAIHRHFGVSSRSELLARWVRK